MKLTILAALVAVLVLAHPVAAANQTSGGNFNVLYASEVAMGEPFTLVVTDGNNVTRAGLGCSWSAGIVGTGQSFSLGEEWTPGQSVSFKTDADFMRFGVDTNYTQTVYCSDGNGNSADFTLPLTIFAPKFNNTLINIPIYLAANPMLVLLSCVVLFILFYAATIIIGPHLH